MSPEKLQERLNAEVERIGRKLNADVVTALVYDITTARFCLPAGYGLRDPDTFHDPRLAPRSGRVAGAIVRERRPIVVEHIDDRSHMYGPFSQREKIQAAAGYPLLNGVTAVGVLFVSFRKEHHFDEALKRAIAKEAVLLSRIVVQADVWERLHNCQKPQKEESVSILLQSVLELACDATSLSVAVWQLDENGKITLTAGTGLTNRYFENGHAKVGDGSWIAQVLDGEILTINDLSNGPQSPLCDAANAAGWLAKRGIPVRVRGRIRGVVEGLSYKSWIDPADHDVLVRLTDLISVTLQRDYHFDHEARILAEITQARDFRRAIRATVVGAVNLTSATHGGVYRWQMDCQPVVLYSYSVADSSETEMQLPPHVDTIANSREYDEQFNTWGPSLHVPLEVGEELAVLYVFDSRGNSFGTEDQRLLETLAQQVSVAVRWPRLLLRASASIDRESVKLFSQKDEYQIVLKDILKCQKTPFDFASLQIINDPVIEMVCGTGRAAEWQGRSKHLLEQKQEMRDIQADIALAMPPRVEILKGNDIRFDPWVYNTFRHDRLLRTFVPIILATDVQGNVLEQDSLEAWLRKWRTIEPEYEKRPDGWRHFAKLDIPDSQVSYKVIGTVEAGYDDFKANTIEIDDAIALAKSAAHVAARLDNTLLKRVFQTVVDHAVRISGAKYASLHYDRSKGSRYAHEVCSRGQSGLNFLEEHRPQSGGLGDRAIKAGKPLFVPDHSSGDDDKKLERDIPAIYAKGITAIAAIPLPVSAEPNFDPCESRSNESREGVLYVGFGKDNGKVHHFYPDEIAWLTLLASSAADAIRHASSYIQMQEQARLLANLHAVSKSLVSIPEDPDLLAHIAGSVLNILGADVVTIYQYSQQDDRFDTPPTIAGRLVDKGAMRTTLSKFDTPARLLKGVSIKPVYALNARNHILLDPARRRRKRPSFVEREMIKSAAAVPLVTGTERDREVVGILFVNFRRPQHFTGQLKAVVETLASTAAVAIINRRLLEMFRVGDNEIIGAESLDQVLGRIVDHAVSYAHASSGELKLFDVLRSQLTIRYRSTAKPTKVKEAENRESQQAIADWVMENLKTALITNYMTDGRCAHVAKKSDASELCVPLAHNGRCLGVLSVTRSKAEAFDTRHRTVLEALADRAVLALLNDRAQTQLKTNEKLATLGGLTGTLLHRLKNDLLGITFHATQGDAEKVVALTDSFLTQVKRLRNWSDPNRHPVALHEVLQTARQHVDIPGTISFSQKLEPNLPMVSADLPLLAEVFGILIKNAIEAMSDSGELIVSGKPERYINMPWVVLRVKDTGGGIDELTMKTLFEPKHSSKAGGLGIGLWLARSYVELLGGQLDVESDNKGATFIVGLPAIVDEPKCE